MNLTDERLLFYAINHRESILMPMVTNSGVHAAFPSPAADYEMSRIDLTQVIYQNPDSTFICDFAGDCMVDLHIPPSVYLVIDRSLEPNDYSIVVAVVDGEWCLRQYRKSGGRQWLQCRNKAKRYPDIELNAYRDFEIWGVVHQVLANVAELVFYDRFDHVRPR